MARSFGRVLASIWDDQDFRALSPGAQRQYMFLISQPDLEHSGVIPLRPRRWAQSCASLAVEEIAADDAELAAARFVVVDEDTEELLVRSLIRRDEVWKQPNVFKSACRHAVRVKSAAIREVLAAELERLDLSLAKEEVRAYRDDALLALAKGSPNPSPTLPPTLRERSPEGPGNPSGRPRGKGEGKGEGSGEGGRPSAKGSPATPAGSIPLWPCAVPDESRDMAALVGEIQAARRELGASWSAAAIERALRLPAVSRHPWHEIRGAALAVARDPESQHPGRLAHDGPWWERGAPRASPAPAWPEWCGDETCNPNTRRREDPATGADRGPCPECHPSKARAS
jgi:hypothetical protein